MDFEKMLQIPAQLIKIRSIDDFIYWFSPLPLPMQIFVCVGGFGVIAIFYIFIKAIFSDNE